MPLSDKAIQEYKDIFEKKYNKKLTNSEAEEGARNLLAFTEILLDISIKEESRKKRLVNEPKGFSLEKEEGIYNCRVCFKSVSGSNAWWDLNGIKCLDCQRNIDEGIIPEEICINDQIWLKDWQLESELKIHSSTIRKLRKEGKLNGIDLKTIDGQRYFTVYMIKDNMDFLKKYQNEKNKAKINQKK